MSLNKEPLVPGEISRIIAELRKSKSYVKELTDYEFDCVIQALNAQIEGQSMYVARAYMDENANPENLKIIENSMIGKPKQFIKDLQQVRAGIDNQFDELNEKYKCKFGHEIPYGAYLFEEIKKTCYQFENIIDRINEFKKIRHFWVNVSLADSEVIGDKEISERLIPLLENEIKLLEDVELKKKEAQNTAPPHQAETKTDKLKAELGKYGFFELPKVKELSEPNKQSLVELISKNDLPYCIAMFEYLGFLKHLKAEYFDTDYKLFQEVAKWFEVAERAVKGNIYVLNEKSAENRNRYTADQKKQIVQKDYEKLI